MKKFLFMFALMLSSVVAFSQTLVDNKAQDNWSLGLNVGTVSMLHPRLNGSENLLDGASPIVNLSVIKDVTDELGLQLDSEVGFANNSKVVDHTNIGVNGLMNLNNIIHGYRGVPDRVEVVPFLGMGWHHNYDFDHNSITGKGGVRFNWNLCKERKWQINVVPSITYLLAGTNIPQLPQPMFDSRRAYVGLQVGATYKFKNSKKTHNHVICENIYTQQEMMIMEAEKNHLEKTIILSEKLSKEKDDVIKVLAAENDSLKQLPKNEITIVSNNTLIGFNIGQSKITNLQVASLHNLANVIKENKLNVSVIGYSDAKTGTEKRNMELSVERAESVKDALVNLGVDESTITVEGKGSTVQLFDENDLNRVVVVEAKN